MRFDSIKAAMESVPRCILVFDGAHFGCTSQEGSPYGALPRRGNPTDVVRQFVGAEEVQATPIERRMLHTVRDRREQWAAEWWHGPDGAGAGEWLRPLVCL